MSPFSGISHSLCWPRDVIQRKTRTLEISRQVLTHCGLVWRHISGTTLAQVMACCLTVSSHYLNQYWLLISKVIWHSPESSFTTSLQTALLYNEFGNLEIILLKLQPHLPGANELSLCGSGSRKVLLCNQCHHCYTTASCLVQYRSMSFPFILRGTYISRCSIGTATWPYEP